MKRILGVKGIIAGSLSLCAFVVALILHYTNLAFPEAWVGLSGFLWVAGVIGVIGTTLYSLTRRGA